MNIRHFLAHVNRELKWTFLIAYRSSVCLSVHIPHFHFLLQNHKASCFNQTWHKAFLGESDSSLFKWRATSCSKGRTLRNYSENTLTNLEIFYRITGSISTKGDTKHLWLKQTRSFTNKDNSALNKDDMFFLSLNYCYDNCMITALRKCVCRFGFLSERCGPWADCVTKLYI